MLELLREVEAFPLPAPFKPPNPAP
jgi:hypothetical protein